MPMQDRATSYAIDVVEGRVIACKEHNQACKRHLEDLERQGTKGFPYYWDAKSSEEIIDYANSLTIVEGEAPKQVDLFPFQHFDLGVPMGWKNEKGYRRFRTSYESMARQNGKTFKNGIRGSYLAGFGGYNYGRLFCVATKKRQARIAWEEISKFIQADRDLSELFEIKDYKSLIVALDTMCTIEALSKDSSLDDGFRAIFNSVDEIHQHKDNSIYKALHNGMKTLKECLLSMITTRGFDKKSFCFDMDQYARNILSGVAVNETMFVDIYTLDEGDKIFDEKNWIKANPLLALTEQGLISLRNDAQTAQDMGGMELRDFIVKSLNMWPGTSENQFVNADQFVKCGNKKTLHDFKGMSCAIGLDLSKGGDLTTFHLEFKYFNEERNRIMYFNHSHSFMPRGRMDEHIASDSAPYDIWETQELITVTGGEYDYKNDYKFIIKELWELKNRYQLKYIAIGYDPHNADAFLSDLEEFGCPLVEVKQSARSLNSATEDLQLLIKQGDYEYNEENELLKTSFVNAKIVKNSFGEKKVDKEPNAKVARLDPVDAAVDAHFVHLTELGDAKINPEDELKKYNEMMNWKGV